MAAEETIGNGTNNKNPSQPSYLHASNQPSAAIRNTIRLDDINCQGQAINTNRQQRQEEVDE